MQIGIPLVAGPLDTTRECCGRRWRRRQAEGVCELEGAAGVLRHSSSARCPCSPAIRDSAHASSRDGPSGSSTSRADSAGRHHVGTAARALLGTESRRRASPSRAGPPGRARARWTPPAPRRPAPTGRGWPARPPSLSSRSARTSGRSAGANRSARRYCATASRRDASEAERSPARVACRTVAGASSAPSAWWARRASSSTPAAQAARMRRARRRRGAGRPPAARPGGRSRGGTAPRAVGDEQPCGDRFVEGGGVGTRHLTSRSGSTRSPIRAAASSTSRPPGESRAARASTASRAEAGSSPGARTAPRSRRRGCQPVSACSAAGSWPSRRSARRPPPA